jgi:Zn-dependent protease/CBS domain-containing protein
MVSGWRVGSVFGIPIFVDSSWFLILIFVELSIGGYWNRIHPDWGPSVAYGAALLTALLFFVSVLLHELGHSVVALRQGIKVSSITLFMFGGVASIDQESKTPGNAFWVAIAGPMVSFLLFFLLNGLANIMPGEDTPLNAIVSYLGGTNFILALFNLLPGLPLDGGQILKAAIWKLTGSRLKGVRWAAKTGAIVGWMMIASGAFVFLYSKGSSGLWFALVGWFIVQNATTYNRLTELQETLLALKANDAMTRNFRVLDATMTLRQFADEYLIGVAESTVYFASSDGRYRGLVVSEDLHQVERSEWETETLFRIIRPLEAIPTVEETTPLVEVIDQIEMKQLRQITVLSPAGAVAGIVDRGDIVRALALKLKIVVSDVIIKQIKEDGAYPPGLQLGAIAQSALENADKPN